MKAPPVIYIVDVVADDGRRGTQSVFRELAQARAFLADLPCNRKGKKLNPSRKGRFWYGAWTFLDEKGLRWRVDLATVTDSAVIARYYEGGIAVEKPLTNYLQGTLSQTIDGYARGGLKPLVEVPTAALMDWQREAEALQDAADEYEALDDLAEKDADDSDRKTREAYKNNGVRGWVEHIRDQQATHEVAVDAVFDALPADRQDDVEDDVKSRCTAIKAYLESAPALEDLIIDACLGVPDGILPDDIASAEDAVKGIIAYLKKPKAAASSGDMDADVLAQELSKVRGERDAARQQRDKANETVARLQQGKPADGAANNNDAELAAAKAELAALKAHRQRGLALVQQNADTIKSELSALVDLVSGKTDSLGDLPTSKAAAAYKATA